MILKDIKIEILRIPLKNNFVTALRRVSQLQTILVKITTDSNIVGYGEAPPTAAVTGETVISIIESINSYIKPNIIGKEIEDLEYIHNIIEKSIFGNNSAKAAIDMAIYDIYGKVNKKPLYKALGGTKSILETDITISVNDINTMILHSNQAVQSGFNILKIKVGKNGIKDIDIIKNINNALDGNIRFRIDANQGWTPEEAIKIITKLEDSNINIDFIEQPVKRTDIKGLKLVTKHSLVDIVADESVFNIDDAKKVIENKAANIVNIKLMKTGGIYNALKIYDLAMNNGIKCMVGCMLESKVGVTAATHLALAKNINIIDLDSPLLCKTNPIRGGIGYTNDKIVVSDSYGLGIGF
jgi:o-succinylbenzoate synthase